MSWLSRIFKKEIKQPTQVKYLVTYEPENKVWEIPRTQDGWIIKPYQPALRWKNQTMLAWQQKSNKYVSSVSNIDPAAEYLIVSALNMDKVIDFAIRPQIEKCVALTYDKAGYPNQRFKFNPAGEGKFIIQIMRGGYLQVSNASTSNGVQITLTYDTNTAHRYFSIEPAEGVVDGFIIRTFCGKCLHANSVDNFDVVQQQFDPNILRNQVWYLLKV